MTYFSRIIFQFRVEIVLILDCVVSSQLFQSFVVKNPHKSDDFHRHFHTLKCKAYICRIFERLVFLSMENI